MKLKIQLIIIFVFLCGSTSAQKHPYSGVKELKFKFLYKKGDMGEARKERGLKDVKIICKDSGDFSKACNIQFEIIMEPDYILKNGGLSKGPTDIEVAHEWTFNNDDFPLKMKLRLLKEPFSFKGRKIVGYLETKHPEIHETYYLEKSN